MKNIKASVYRSVCSPMYSRCEHRGFPAPVLPHWIGLDWMVKDRVEEEEWKHL